MAKQTVDWHRRCAKNWSGSVEKRRLEYERAKKAFEDSEARLAFYRDQISEAERRGLDGFDRDRLLVKRRS